MKFKTYVPPKSKFHAPSIPSIDTRYRPQTIAFDTECTGLNWATGDKPFGLSVAWRDATGKLQTAWWDWPVDPTTRQPLYNDPPRKPKGLKNGEAYNRPSSLYNFLSWYRDESIYKVGANTKYDRHMIDQMGVTPELSLNNHIYHDVLIAAWCCNSMEPSFKLNDLCEKYLKIDQAETVRMKEEVARLRTIYDNKKTGFKIGPGYSTANQDYWLCKYDNHKSKLCEIYGRKDAARALLLHEYYQQGLVELGNYDAYWREIKVAEVLYQMETRGIRFNKEKCELEKVDLDAKCKQLEFELKLYTGDPNLNINSGKQLIKVLYEDQKLPIIATTKKGQPSVDYKTLKELANWYPDNKVLQILLQYAGYNTGRKYCNNYIKCAAIDEYNWLYDLGSSEGVYVINTTFNQIAVDQNSENLTRTGRLSCSNPNLQNVADPSKSVGSDYVCDSRDFFYPRPGFTLFAIDYSGLELRIFAERCGGKLKEAFLAGRDPHNETRLAVPYLASIENVDRGRKLAKHTNFTIVNCGGAKVLEAKYGVPFQEGEQIVKELYREVPEIKRRQKEAERFAIKHGYIETIFGRKINVDLTRDKNGRYKYAYRASPYDIQGSAADIIKEAMIQVHKFLKMQQWEIARNCNILLSIHDELVIEIKKTCAYKWLLREIISIMEGVAKNRMEIPLKCEIVKCTESWSSLKKQKVNI